MGKTYEKPKWSLHSRMVYEKHCETMHCVVAKDGLFLVLYTVYIVLAVCGGRKGRDERLYEVCFERIYFCYDFHI